MTRREQLQERMEDAYFALLMDDLAQDEGERALAEHETLLSDPDSSVPEEVRRRCLKSIKRGFASRRTRRAVQFSVRLARRAAAVSAVALVLCAAVLASSESARAAALRFAVTRFSDHTLYERDSEGSARSGESVFSGFRVGWVPEGFTPAGSSAAHGFVSQSYVCPDGEHLQIALFDLNGPGILSVDTEDAVSEPIRVRGLDGEIITKDPPEEYFKQLVLPMEDRGCVLYILTLCGGVTAEDLVKIAENVIL